MQFPRFQRYLSNNCSFQDNLKCYTGTPEVNAGRQILNVLRFECPDIPHADADHLQVNCVIRFGGIQDQIKGNCNNRLEMFKV